MITTSETTMDLTGDMRHLCDLIKANDNNLTDSHCKEFFNSNIYNLTSTPSTTTAIPDKCIAYCEHSVRVLMNDYKNYYHGYITLIVSKLFICLLSIWKFSD